MKQYNQEDFENQNKDLAERLKQQKLSPWEKMSAKQREQDLKNSIGDISPSKLKQLLAGLKSNNGKSS
jgi:hypothetical protein